nr:unnamed protein product [Callosobruchus analis]
MHSICLGVMKKLLNTWITGPLSTRLPHHVVNNIPQKLLALSSHIPVEFNRKPRALNELASRKTTNIHTLAGCYRLKLVALLTDNVIFQVHEIFVGKGNPIDIIIYGKEFVNNGSLYSYPLNSAQLKIFVVKNVGNKFSLYNITDVISKLIRLPFRDHSSVCLPLVDCSELSPN